jgi:hypothetical protein
VRLRAEIAGRARTRFRAGLRDNKRFLMPTISEFYGIVIRMYFNDHAPPHFHVIYGEYEATVDIDRLSVLEGSLPKGALQLTLDWAGGHKPELLA